METGIHNTLGRLCMLMYHWRLCVPCSDVPHVCMHACMPVLRGCVRRAQTTPAWKYSILVARTLSKCLSMQCVNEHARFRWVCCEDLRVLSVVTVARFNSIRQAQLGRRWRRGPLRESLPTDAATNQQWRSMIECRQGAATHGLSSRQHPAFHVQLSHNARRHRVQARKWFFPLSIHVGRLHIENNRVRHVKFSLFSTQKKKYQNDNPT